MVPLPETFLNRYPSKSGVKGIMAFFASQAISFLFIPFFFIPVNKSSDTSHLLFSRVISFCLEMQSLSPNWLLFLVFVSLQIVK